MGGDPRESSPSLAETGQRRYNKAPGHCPELLLAIHLLLPAPFVLTRYRLIPSRGGVAASVSGGSSARTPHLRAFAFQRVTGRGAGFVWALPITLLIPPFTYIIPPLSTRDDTDRPYLRHVRVTLARPRWS